MHAYTHTHIYAHIYAPIPHEQSSCASACNTDTTPTQPRRIYNTHRTKNNTTNVEFNRIVASS